MGETLIEIHDSELLKIESVLKKLNERQYQSSVNLDGFRREAIERFEQIGFQVAVRCFETDVAGVFAFDIDIVDRLAGEFDPDRQVHEVTRDLLDLGEGGVIKSQPIVEAHHHHGHGGHAH